MMALIPDQLAYFNRTFALPNLQYLIQNLPVFCVHSSQIEIIQGPVEFYNRLLDQSSKADKRIAIASLYLGNGPLEHKLVTRMLERLDCKENLRIHWLLDYIRASRNEVNSRTMLLPLLNGNINCTVSLFHTPNLRGIRKWLTPNRYNEVFGLQHMKVYVFDDSVIISGANLSNDYFTNRQDRYYIIKNCAELANFYEELIKQVSRRSFRLKEDNTMELHNENSIHPYKGNEADYCTEFATSVSEFWDSEIENNAAKLDSLYNQRKIVDSQISDRTDTNVPDTLLFPTIQMPQLGITKDSEATLNFFDTLAPESEVYLATGYFNLTKEYGYAILRKKTSEFKIICAHPTANGFLGARGLSGGVPAAYTNLLRSFYYEVGKHSLLHQIRFFEYQKQGWTFHAKGLWYVHPMQPLPSSTVVGSTNFGYRSVNKDLESQLFISTSCPQLQFSFFDEKLNLFKFATPVTGDVFGLPERKVPFWVKLVTYYMRYFF